MESVDAFFNSYARAFAAYDADAIAACYVVPCLFVRDGAPVSVTTADGLAESVAALLDLHRAWDVQTVRPATVSLLEHGPGHATARVDWRLGRAASRMTWTFATSYTLVPDALVPEPDRWRVAVAVTHDAPF